ncbi:MULTISPECIES: DegT/DnrJ/EryC1/StrS family aminotransferase [unclassified Flavobacterium]|uniref:DegT/DnrJ/EryC1/StrS family aminotransferase n=1 Tax=unclassified Flavobacterium TaxID=196869 RepID=UPI003F8E8A80
MAENKIWISTPQMGGNEMKYIQEAIDTNWVSTVGENITVFEENLENYLGAGNYVTALNSGTAAIHLGLIMLGVEAGDEVICQSLTFSASANPIMYLGATPIFIDSELHTWNLCPITLEEAIIDRINNGKKPKAIIAVHLYGMPYQVDAVRMVADKYMIPILEDSAEALGSSYKGEKCGSFGDMKILSFNGSKIITTSGGGALVCSSIALKNKALFLATQSKENAPHYQHSEIGYNYRMSNIAAGIGRAQMEVLEQHVVTRRSIHEFYTDLFANIDGVTVFCEPNKDYFSNYWLTTILVDPEVTYGISRVQIMLALEVENIESRAIMKPMHLQPIFEKYPYYGGKIAQKIFFNGLCLPSGNSITKNDLLRISTTVKSLFAKDRRLSNQ